MRRIAPALLACTLAAPAFAATSDTPVTFSKDVAPIFFSNCVQCHRPGDIAPMSLLDYESARPWASSIKNRVANREMPPWHLDRNVGIREYKDDPSLSDAEISTIVRWVDGGAPGVQTFPALPARVVDVTGAGDAMLAAFLAALAGGLGAAEAARHGHAAAALTIESSHTVLPTLSPAAIRARLVPPPGVPAPAPQTPPQGDLS